MKKGLTLLFAIITWASVILQFYLIIENRIAPLSETIVRFFSFFTILTNILVAVYLTLQFSSFNGVKKAGVLTAVTVYITIVGAVYQFVLRQVWEPEGLQQIVDELLHSINPCFVIIYWCLYEKKNALAYRMIPAWLIYPFVYIVFVLIRGSISGFYPYPFIRVSEIGFQTTIINCFMLMLLFVLTSALYIFTGRKFFGDGRTIVTAVKD